MFPFLVAVAAALATDPDLPSEPARLASHSLLLDIAAAGSRYVTVGERGQILVSSDRGQSWMQSLTPTQALLTGVCFFDAQRGIAVGHDEVILVTADGGQTWTKAHYAPQSQQPLLDVWCGSGAGHAIAIGAYGVYFVSTDGGNTWDEKKMQAIAPVAPAAHDAHVAQSTPRPDTDDGSAGGFHLNAIAADASGRLYVAAEAGHLYRSGDGGSTWTALPSPYSGSFFGVLPIAGDTVLAFGLRGNLFRSEDAGLTWARVMTGTEAMLDAGVVAGPAAMPGDAATLRNPATLGDPEVVVVGLSGAILLSRDGGRSFSVSQQADRKGIAAALVGDGALITVGEGGVKVVSLSAGMARGGSRP